MPESSKPKFERKKIIAKLINKKQETRDIYSFSFETKEIQWIAGQHGVFTILGDKLEGGNSRALSFASAPEENEIKIGVRIVETGASNFKLALKNMQIGEEIQISGPMGHFIIEDYKTPMVLIGGGIGIPPVRALLKGIEYAKPELNYIEVLYADDNAEFAFTEDLNKVNKDFEKITLRYLQDRTEFYAKLEEFREKYGNTAKYYVSGTPGMVNAVGEALESKGTLEQNIVKDPFLGLEEIY